MTWAHTWVMIRQTFFSVKVRKIAESNEEMEYVPGFT